MYILYIEKMVDHIHLQIENINNINGHTFLTGNAWSCILNYSMNSLFQVDDKPSLHISVTKAVYIQIRVNSRAGTN